MIAKKEYRPDPLKLSGAPLLNYNPNLSAYDGLMGGEAHAVSYTHLDVYKRQVLE